MEIRAPLGDVCEWPGLWFDPPWAPGLPHSLAWLGGLPVCCWEGEPFVWTRVHIAMTATTAKHRRRAAGPRRSAPSLHREQRPKRRSPLPAEARGYSPLPRHVRLRGQAEIHPYRTGGRPNPSPSPGTWPLGTARWASKEQGFPGLPPGAPRDPAGRTAAAPPRPRGLVSRGPPRGPPRPQRS